MVSDFDITELSHDEILGGNISRASTSFINVSCELVNTYMKLKRAFLQGQIRLMSLKIKAST